MNYGLAGVVFEGEIAQRFRGLGWAIEPTPVTGDFGADLIARFGAELLVVQCKDYGSPAGVGAVQEAHFARTHYRATGALVVARNGFTRAAIQAASTTGVEIWQPSDISPGSRLDRSPQRRRLDEEWAAYDKEQKRSNDWRDYDKALAQYAVAIRKLRLSRILLACIAACLVLQAFSASDTFLLLVSFIGCLFLCVIPTEPVKPETERRGAIIVCDICLTRLRLEYGRDGLVRCPVCKVLTGACT
jgi:hypothetical protein